MLTAGEKLLIILKYGGISIGTEGTLAKLIVVSEINSVELGDLIHTILEKGICFL